MKDLTIEKNKNKIYNLSTKYYNEMTKEKFNNPSILELMLFRIYRTSMSLSVNKGSKDYLYFKDKGWFKADYYYQVKLNWLKRRLGGFFDWITKILSS